VQKKNGKDDEAAGARPPAARTVLGVGLPPVPEKKAPRSAGAAGVDELSGSLLVDEPSSEAPTAQKPRPNIPPKSETAPRPNVPQRSETATLPSEQRPPVIAAPATVAPPLPDVHPPPLTPAPPPRVRASDSSRAEPRKPLLPIIALAGLLAGIGLVTLVVRATRSHGGSTSTTSSPSAATSSSASLETAAERLAPVASQTEAPAPSTRAASPVLTECAVAGDPKVVAPRAIVAAGIEVRAFGKDVALGFAPNDHQAMLVRLDPATLAVSQSTVSHSMLSIRRVTPVPGRTGKLDLAIDVDRNGDPLQGRRTLPLDPPVQVGVSDSHLAWAPFGRDVQESLWRLEGEGPVEALRGARSESNLAMVAIAFRRGGAVWLGAAEGSNALAPKGDLSRVNGLGPMVGSPAIAVNEGIAIAAWADRPSPDDPWQLRWTRFKPGEAAGEPRAFKPPPGGKGEEAMSPGLAVVPDGRFLLVWTEGPASAHAVRAVTLSADGTASGKAIAISADGVNAGQGQAALTASGRGLVAFLQSSTSGDTSGFHVAVTPIVCSP
jgi:hypothetical protein